MKSPKLTKILCVIIVALLILEIAIFSSVTFTQSDNDISTVSTAPEIPEGEPLMREYSTEPPTELDICKGAQP